jgi:hypothetical protein
MPDVVDYLGAPKVVTGADYMHALAALGYNVENMSSPIPTMAKIASAQTNFLDNLYNQNLDRQAKQATLQETLARANNLDSVTDYNNKSLNLRLNDLDLRNRELKQQIDFAQQAQPFKQRELERQDQQGDIELGILKRKADDLTQAQNALPGALQTLPDPEKDPNFKTNFDNWQTTNAGLLARQDSVGDQARRMRDTAKTRYEGTSRFNQSLADIKEFEGYQAKGTIDKSYDADKTVFGNPAQAQALLVQGRALDAQAELQEIITDPTIPQAYRDKLNDAFTYVHNHVSSDTGVRDIQTGKASLYFNPDGKLNSTARAMVDGIKALKGMKQATVKARLPIPGVTGEVGKAGEKPYVDFEGTEAQYQQRILDLRAQQAAEQQRTAEMADIPNTPENLEDKAAHQRGEISLEELHRRINARNAAKAKPTQNPLGRAQAGFQEGGLVTGTPGPDQVPANLTSGEFVVNRDAVADIGLPVLEALNAGTSATTGAGDEAPLNLASGTRPPVSTGTQQDIQFQQPQQTSPFQQLFGKVPYQSSVDAPPPGPLPNVPVRNQIPVIRPQQTPAPRAEPVQAQTPAPRAQPVQTPAVTSGPTTGDTSLASTGGTTLMPKYTTGDAFLNAHYLGDGKLSGLATNFGHDVNGRPDTYMLSKLGGGSRIGAFGTDVVNPTTAGASVPIQTFRAFVGNPNDPQVRARVQSGRVGVEVWAPNGRSRRLHIVDLGPGKGENASLDLTGSAMRELGVSDNFGAVYRFYSE